MKGFKKFALSCAYSASSRAVSATETSERQSEYPSLASLDLVVAASSFGAIRSVVHPNFALSVDESVLSMFAKEAA